MDRKDGNSSPMESKATKTVRKIFCILVCLFLLKYIGQPPILISEIFLNAMHHCAAVAYSSGYLTQFFLTHIAYGKHARDIGGHFFIGYDIALFIYFQFCRQEGTVRSVAYENEHAIDI